MFRDLRLKASRKRVELSYRKGYLRQSFPMNVPMKVAFLTMATLGLAQSVFRTDTRAVEVTVVATRADGSLVTDLRTDEIRVFDNNKRQTIASFEKPDREKLGGEKPGAGTRPLARSIVVLDA
jgi:hypothetical protein